MIVVDIEADNLLPDVTEIHCICTKNIATEQCLDFYEDSLTQYSLLLQGETLIMHNGIDYDIPLLKKIFNFDFKGKIVDTIILSQLLFPERPGGHSLEAWGERLGYPKVEHEDWSKFTPEMLRRCRTDVVLTAMVYEALCSEAGERVEGITVPSYRFA
jgi:DNA polymerase III alpha subunit (gram-positive type)